MARRAGLRPLRGGHVPLVRCHIMGKFNILPPAKSGKFLYQELPMHLIKQAAPNPRPA